MTTTVNLRRLLDRKQWEPCNFPPVATTVGAFVVMSNLHDQYRYLFTSATAHYQYDPFEDGWQQIPSSAAGGTWGAGSCGERHPWGPRGFPSSGTATTITTSLTLARDLRGYKVRIIAGPGAGDELTIASNTIGANAVVTFTSSASATLTSSSEFIFYTGSIYFWNAGTMSSSSFRRYDFALNTWSSLSVTGAPASWGTDGKLVSTPGYLEDFATGTATSATSTTLSNSGKSWNTNQWTNYQLRITAGTGIGQFRTISSNTGTQITVSSAWTVTPDATSVYVIEGNSDYLYLLGNNAVTLYRYSIAGNSWTTLSPGVARAGAAVAGMSANWVWNVPASDWTAEVGCKNGRYIYSYRGGTAVIDRYDIAANSWKVLTYSPATEVFATGTQHVYRKGFIYSMQTTGKLLKFDIAKQQTEGCSQLWYTQSTVHLGGRMFYATYNDGGTEIDWLYYQTHNQQMMFRLMLI